MEGLVLLQIYFEFDYNDLMNTHKKIIETSKVHKRRMLFFYIISILLYIVTIINLRLTAFSVIFVALWLIFFPWLYKHLAYFGAKRIVNKQNNTLLFGKHVVDINDEGIHRTTETTKTLFTWNQFIKYQEDTSYYFLFISEFQSLTIPKRAFDNETSKLFDVTLKKFLIQK